MNENQKDTSKEDSSEESQQDIAANEKGIHNLWRETSKMKLQSLQPPACAHLKPLMSEPRVCLHL